MRSLGAPSLRREIERQFFGNRSRSRPRRQPMRLVPRSWLTPADFAIVAGCRFLCRNPYPGCTCRSSSERRSGCSGSKVWACARSLAVSDAVSRELRRNAATRGGKLEHCASVAQWKAELVARMPKPAKLVTNRRLLDYVQDRLAGKIQDADGLDIACPKQAATLRMASLSSLSIGVVRQAQLSLSTKSSLSPRTIFRVTSSIGINTQSQLCTYRQSRQTGF